MPKSTNTLIIQWEVNRLPILLIIGLLFAFTVLGASYAYQSTELHYLSVVAFVAGLGVPLAYGMIAIPYEGNKLRVLNAIVVGEGEVCLHYIKGNARETERVKGDLGRNKTVLQLAKPATFETTGEPDALQVEIRHYFEWDERIGREGDYANLDNIYYFNRDTETAILWPLTPTDEIDRRGVHHWRPTFDLLLTVSKDAANPAMMEAILLGQKMMYVVKMWLAAHPDSDPEEVYGKVAKVLVQTLDGAIRSIEQKHEGEPAGKRTEEAHAVS